jgi:Entner-Doudoroff aldolase
MDAAESNAWFDRARTRSRVMAIMRGYGVSRSVAVAERAWDLGIDLVELPLQTPEDRDALEAVVAAAAARGRDLPVGAGTILTEDGVHAAADAGAAFVVSPGFDPDVAAASLGRGLPPLPGVATATEVQAVHRTGLRWMKVFPASVLGEGWVPAMHGPFPDARWIATGGMDAAVGARFLDRGVDVIAVGSALDDDTQLPRLAELVGTGARA